VDSHILLIRVDGTVDIAGILYGYRKSNSTDQRIRLILWESDRNGQSYISTQVLSECVKVEAGLFESVEIKFSSEIHVFLDNQSADGLLDEGKDYTIGNQQITTLTANEILLLDGSVISELINDETIIY